MIRYTIAAAIDTAIIAASTLITEIAYGGNGFISIRYGEAGNMKYVEYSRKKFNRQIFDNWNNNLFFLKYSDV